MQINGFFKFEKFSLFLSILSWGKPGSPALQSDSSRFEPPWNLKSHCIYIGELIGVPHVLEKTLESPLDCKGDPTSPS